MKNSYQERYDRYLSAVNAALGGFFAEKDLPQARLLEAMRYSLLAGGKRIRPIITLEFCRLCAGDSADALAVACAVEMLHTYSLIHDDLPCMDDDELRRGIPTNHIVFDEATAVLAGDALQSAAFSVLLGDKRLSSARRAKCARLLADAIGAYGMCGGQTLDIENKADNWDSLVFMHGLKTGAMLRTSAVMGVIAGGGGKKQRKAADKYAESLGLAFQIRDDMLDAIADSDQLGKPTGSDERSGRATFLTVFGLDRCEALVMELTESAKNEVRSAFEDYDFLCELADELSARWR